MVLHLQSAGASNVLELHSLSAVRYGQGCSSKGNTKGYLARECWRCLRTKRQRVSTNLIDIMLLAEERLFSPPVRPSHVGYFTRSAQFLAIDIGQGGALAS